MADDRYEPKLRSLYAALGVAPRPSTLLSDLIAPAAPQPTPMAKAIADLLVAQNAQPRPTFLGGLAGAIEASPTSPSGSLAGLGLAPALSPRVGVANPLTSAIRPAQSPAAKLIKRKAFFSFHFADVMRVNVVRNAWKIAHPDSALMRSFYDSSLWESRKLEGPDALKALIRGGVEYTSAVCVLVGSDTWLRRWVKYEIARAIIDGRGLLAVHLNSIRHHHTKTPHTRGLNPLDFMAVGKVQEKPWIEPRHYLFERVAVSNGVGGLRWAWQRYSDHTQAVSLPRWLADPAPAYVTPLSDSSDEYDYIVDAGHRNIGAWIDRAAQRAGR